jgi:hypothetical protein
MASEEVWRHYHGRMRAIERGFSIDAENLRAVAMMRGFDREALRAEVREMVARGLEGPFLIPV